MKEISLKVLTFLAVLTTAGLVVADTSDNETVLNQIAGYRQWTRVNRKPVKVPVQISIPTATVDLRAVDVAI
jgi:hypothetical protein